MNRHIFFLYIFFLELNCYASVQRDEQSTFKVALRDIPESINIRTSASSIEMYIAHQIYFPLVTTDSNGNLNSHFLDMTKSKATSTSFKDFRLCLKPGIKFSDGSPIKVTDLKNTIEDVHANEFKKQAPSIGIDKDCVTVKLNVKRFNYFHRLMTVKSTIIKSTSKKQLFPIGLGSYKVYSHNNEQIVLKRSIPTKTEKDFEWVHIKLYSENEKLEQLNDPNHIYQIDLPNLLGKNFKPINYPSMKIYGLYNSVKDNVARETILNCIDKELLAKSVSFKLKPTDRLIPAGYLGYMKNKNYGDIRKDCIKANLSNTPEITFLDPSNNSGLKKFSKNLTQKTGLNIKYHVGTLEELRAGLKNKSEFLFFAGLSAENHSSAAMKESGWAFAFIKSLPYKIEGADNLLSTLNKEDNINTRNTTFSELEDKSLKAGAFIPIGRLLSLQYYPKKFKNFKYASLGTGIIDISSVELR